MINDRHHMQDYTAGAYCDSHPMTWILKNGTPTPFSPLPASHSHTLLTTSPTAAQHAHIHPNPPCACVYPSLFLHFWILRALHVHWHDRLACVLRHVCPSALIAHTRHHLTARAPTAGTHQTLLIGRSRIQTETNFCCWLVRWMLWCRRHALDPFTPHSLMASRFLQAVPVCPLHLSF